jgi:peptide/nickel transport system substrate-binding protein
MKNRLLMASALTAVLSFGNVAFAETLNIVNFADPALNQIFRGSRLLEPVLEPLVRRDPRNGQPTAVLAEKWELADDLTSATFTLKSGLEFHDGTPVTSADVVFSLEQAGIPENNSGAYSVTQRVAKIEAVDELTVKVTFKSPTNNLWDLFYYTPVLDRDTFAGIADASTINGTGPFKWNSWRVGSELSLVKNEDYRDAEDVFYDELKYLVIVDPSAQQAALRSNRAQMAFGLTAQDARSLESAGFQVISGEPMTVGMAMNVSIPPFNNKQVRQAVGYAVDRERLVAQANAGIGTPTDLWWDPKVEGLPEELGTFYSYDPEKARKMIEEAGAVGAEAPLIFPTNPLYMSYYNIIADGLTQAGLLPRAVQLEDNEAVGRLLRGDLGEGYLFYDRTTLFSPVSVASDSPVFRTGDIGPQKYESEEYSALLNELQNAGKDTYPAALEALTRFVLDEAFAHAFVTVPNVVTVSSKVDVSTPGENAPVFTVSGSLTGVGIRPAQ